jgi:flagellar protein FlaG
VQVFQTVGREYPADDRGSTREGAQAAELPASPTPRVPGAYGSERTRRYRNMGMEIPGILKSNPVQDVLLKEARILPDRQPRQVDLPAEPKKLSRQEIELQAKALEKTFLAFNRRVVLSVNETINQVIIKVVDTDTDKVIKEIPAEEVQHLIAKIKETIGLLVDEKI